MAEARCSICGSTRDGSTKHIRFGADLDNPVKHEFVPLEAAMSETSPFYVIEAAWSRESPAYMSTTRGCGGHNFEWTFSIERALKFWDRDSADWMGMALRQLRPELFPSVVPYPKMVAHSFMEREDKTITKGRQ